MKTVETTAMKRKVGECPACREYLWAEVIIETRVDVPRWSDQIERPGVHAEAALVAMAVSHSCDKRDDA